MAGPSPRERPAFLCCATAGPGAEPPDPVRSCCRIEPDAGRDRMRGIVGSRSDAVVVWAGRRVVRRFREGWPAGIAGSTWAGSGSRSGVSAERDADAAGAGSYGADGPTAGDGAAFGAAVMGVGPESQKRNYRNGIAGVELRGGAGPCSARVGSSAPEGFASAYSAAGRCGGCASSCSSSEAPDHWLTAKRSVRSGRPPQRMATCSSKGRLSATVFPAGRVWGIR